MERVTQQIAANAEEGAAAGEELRKHATTVGRTVDSLQALVGQDPLQPKAPVRKPVAPPGKTSSTSSRYESSRPTKLGASTNKYQPSFHSGQSSNVGVMDKKDPFPMDDSFEEF